MPTLLCIDDIPQGLALRKLMLGEKGYDVLTACDGPTGIEMARQNPIDVVVLDYKMPGMTGDEVAEIIKRERPEVPIILLSS
jgi:CheY-like chemotaxis protein